MLQGFYIYKCLFHCESSLKLWRFSCLFLCISGIFQCVNELPPWPTSTYVSMLWKGIVPLGFHGFVDVLIINNLTSPALFFSVLHWLNHLFDEWVWNSRNSYESNSSVDSNTDKLHHFLSFYSYCKKKKKISPRQLDTDGRETETSPEVGPEVRLVIYCISMLGFGELFYVCFLLVFCIYFNMDIFTIV